MDDKLELALEMSRKHFFRFPDSVVFDEVEARTCSAKYIKSLHDYIIKVRKMPRSDWDFFMEWEKGLEKARQRMLSCLAARPEYGKKLERWRVTVRDNHHKSDHKDMEKPLRRLIEFLGFKDGLGPFTCVWNFSVQCGRDDADMICAAIDGHFHLEFVECYFVVEKTFIGYDFSDLVTYQEACEWLKKHDPGLQRWEK